jgi:hypothetical protein
MKTSNLDTVQLQLTSDEALVLFEFVQRFSETDTLTLQNPAEEQALWNLCCHLEEQLAEPFAANYVQLLADARRRLGCGEVF